MTFLWHSDPAAAENYHFAVGDHIEVVEAAQSVMRGLSANAAELLVIVGPEVGLDAASTLAEQVRQDRPEVSVILLRRRLEVAVLAQALRAGFREVVASDDLTSLSDACRRSLEISRHLAGFPGSPRSSRARSSPFSTPRVGVARRRSPRTWVPTWHPRARGSCWSTLTWPSAMSRSVSSCARWPRWAI